MRFSIISTLALLLACLGCGDGQSAPEIGNDAEPRLIAGGGTGDGAIDGRLNVYVLDEHSERPIRGAFVMLGSGPDPSFSATTDNDGLVTFRDPVLAGSQIVTVYEEGYTLSTLFGLDAANLTVMLEKIEGQPVELDTATVQGEVSGFENLPVAPAGSARLALVSYSIPDIFEEDFEFVEQEGDPPENMVIDAPGMDGSYSLETWVGEQSIWALAGIFTPGQNGEFDFEPSHMGLVRGIQPSEDQVLEDVDISLDIPVDQDCEIATTGVPERMELIQNLVLLELGQDEQLLVSALSPEPGPMKLPALEGALAGGCFHLVLRAYHEVCEGEDCEEAAPYSMLIRRGLGLADLSPATVDDFLAPPAQMSVDGRTLTFSYGLPQEAEITGGEIEDADGKKLWSFMLFDNASSFQLPVLPAEAGHAGLAGELLWRQQAIAVQGEVDPNDFEFERFNELVTHMAADELAFTP
ncbi:MAG: hypothetical protein JXR96_18075 [Deltaproteobacteria bacterium]|nr:hypothetical protein [Deltaproteobacteria bacterium]